MNIDSIMLPKLSIHDRKALCQYYLNYLYQDTKPVFSEQNTVEESYGEILSPSINKLITSITFTSQDVFYDLGSGLGKLVLQIFLQTEIKQATGIEIIPELHIQAQIAANKMRHEIPELFRGRELSFLLGNFLELPISQATIVMIGSPCYTPQTFVSLSRVIDRTPSIHTVLSLRPLLTVNRLKFKRTIRIEGSWDAALCYVYGV